MALRSHVVVVEAAGEVFRAPPSLGRQLEARQRAAGADESRALLATDSCPADPATPTGCVAVWPEMPGLTGHRGEIYPASVSRIPGTYITNAMYCDWQP